MGGNYLCKRVGQMSAKLPYIGIALIHFSIFWQIFLSNNAYYIYKSCLLLYEMERPSSSENVSGSWTLSYMYCPRASCTTPPIVTSNDSANCPADPRKGSKQPHLQSPSMLSGAATASRLLP
jgi:hypothetical protein